VAVLREAFAWRTPGTSSGPAAPTPAEGLSD
jgi:hypothetical protein